jgi:hypothetical protein
MMSSKKYFFISFLFLLFILTNRAFSQVDSTFHIYLAFGQSNMQGNATIQDQDKTVNSRFKVMEAVNCSNLGRTKGTWYTAIPPLCRCYTGLTPADYFGRTMVASLPSNIKIGIINVSVAGCKIELFDKNNYQTYVSSITEDWLKNIISEYDGNPYAYLVSLAQLAQQNGVIKGILLHQGESNTGDNQWLTKVKGVYNNLISDLALNPNKVPLLAGEVVNADQGGVCASMNAIIARLPDTIPNSYVISSKGCTDTTDNTHFNAAGYRELGKRYAIKMLKVVYNICDSTIIFPGYIINSGTLKQGDSILVNHGTTLLLSPQPSNGIGTWSWTGAGTSGSSRTQTINTSTQGTYTATVTYTNECNVPSRLSYKIIVCDSTLTEPWYQIDGGEWIQSASIRVRKGSSLLLGPHPTDGQGSWSWTGAGTSGTSREQTPNTSSVGTFDAIATYTNDCGAKSHLSINIRVCDSTQIIPLYQINGGSWDISDSIRVKQNAVLNLGPYPPVGSGIWNWTGAGLSGSAREQTVNTSTPGTYIALVTYSNSCGIVSHLSIKIIIDPLTKAEECKTRTTPIEIYPNPSLNGTFTIKGIEKNTQIELSNIVGEKIAELNNVNQESINITAKPGIYIIKLSYKQQSVYKKVMVK